MSFWEKIAAAQGELRAVKKGSRNNQQNYDYTSAKDVQLEVTEVLLKHGLAVVETKASIEHIDEITTRSGNAMQRVMVKMCVWIGDGEHKISGEAFGCGSDAMDKAVMKANTAAYKYALCTALNLAMGDDPEQDQREEEAARPTDPSLVWFGPHTGKPLAQASLKGAKAYYEIAASRGATPEHFKAIAARIKELEDEESGRLEKAINGSAA